MIKSERGLGRQSEWQAIDEESQLGWGPYTGVILNRQGRNTKPTTLNRPGSILKLI